MIRSVGSHEKVRHFAGNRALIETGSLVFGSAKPWLKLLCRLDQKNIIWYDLYIYLENSVGAKTSYIEYKKIQFQN